MMVNELVVLMSEYTCGYLEYVEILVDIASPSIYPVSARLNFALNHLLHHLSRWSVEARSEASEYRFESLVSCFAKLRWRTGIDVAGLGQSS